MSQYQRDHKRTHDAIGRARDSMKMLPCVTVPLSAAICSIALSPFGITGLLLGVAIGIIVGFYASAIAASTIELLVLLLIHQDNREG